jgi:xanthine dehydrogenase molybdenum-binding subunit
MAAYPKLPNYTQGTQIWADHDLKSVYTSIGKTGFKNYDGLDKASGRAVYTRDVFLPGMLFGVWLTCPYAHAQITDMDTKDAEALPGVRYVLTYKDPEIKGVANSAFMLPVWMLGDTQYYSGGPIGAVIVADTEQIARDALKLLKVTWKELPFTIDVETSAAKDAPAAVEGTANDSIGGGFGPGGPTVFGDITAGFAASDKTFNCDEKRMTISGVGAEPQSCVVKWDGTGNFEFWHHTQVPNSHRAKIASYFKIPKSHVFAHQPYNGHLGGHFQWMMYDSWTIPLIGGILARRLQRPVKMMYDRKDDFTASAPSTHAFHAKVGIKNDGTIQAVQATNYLSIMGFSSWQHLKENTNIKNYTVEAHNVLSNVPHPGPMRCEQTNNVGFWALIQNHAATEAGVDPTVLAPKMDGYNGEEMAVEVAEYKKDHGFPARDSLAEVITKGKQVFGWTAKWHAPKARQLANGRWHGVGTFWGHSWQDASGDGGTAIFFNQDGSVSVMCQIADNGVNQRSTMTQIILEELGVTADQIEWLNNGQETVNFNCGPGSGSQSLCCTGYAFKYAARVARAAILDFVCHDFQYTSGFGEGDGPFLQKAFFPGLTADALDLQNNVIFEKAHPDNKHTLAEVCVNTTFGGHNAGQSNMGPGVMAWQYVSQPALADSYSNYDHHFLGRAFYFLEVEVDTETGEVFPTSVVPVIDVGKVINPEGCLGQMYGASYMGWGRAVDEEQIFDTATGVLLNCNLYDYKVPCIKDLPPASLNMQTVETGIGFGPWGAIGVGEHTATCLWTCLAPAIYNAIGVWVDDYPITPAKVLKALGKA